MKHKLLLYKNHKIRTSATENKEFLISPEVFPAKETFTVKIIFFFGIKADKMCKSERIGLRGVNIST
jgi:hypothetical protein